MFDFHYGLTRFGCPLVEELQIFISRFFFQNQSDDGLNFKNPHYLGNLETFTEFAHMLEPNMIFLLLFIAGTRDLCLGGTKF